MDIRRNSPFGLDSNGNIVPSTAGVTTGNFLVATASCWLPELSKYLAPDGVTMLNTKGTGLPVEYGMDNRTAVTTADGAATTLFTTAGGGVFRATIHLEVSAFTSGTLTYTVSWNDLENNARTLAVSATATGIQQANGLIRLKIAANTSITVQLTGVFVATCDVFCLLEEVQ